MHTGPFYNIALDFFHNPFVVKFLPVLALIFVAFLVVQTVFFSDRNRKYGSVLFLSVCVLTIFIFRGLLNFWTEIQNPDEAHILTPALNFLSDKRLWASGDSTTLGPLAWLTAVVVIEFFNFFGIDCDVTFFLARFISVVLFIIALFFLYKICKNNNLNEKLTRIVLLFYTFFLSFSYSWDMVAYNSEFIYVFMALWILYLIDNKEKMRIVPALLACFLCGLLPFLKLQTVPILHYCEQLCVSVITHFLCCRRHCLFSLNV
jgi:hypothetical protein